MLYITELPKYKELLNNLKNIYAKHGLHIEPNEKFDITFINDDEWRTIAIKYHWFITYTILNQLAPFDYEHLKLLVDECLYTHIFESEYNNIVRAMIDTQGDNYITKIMLKNMPIHANIYFNAGLFIHKMLDAYKLRNIADMVSMYHDETGMYRYTRTIIPDELLEYAKEKNYN